MTYTELAIKGAWVIHGTQTIDERGVFLRLWDGDEAVDRGLEARFVQASLSVNLERGTIRGLHYQLPPSAETKLVRCARGVIFDVIVDLRTHQVVTVELDDPWKTLYIPAWCAHGFQSLSPYSEVAYQMSMPYRPEASAGIRWDDPSLAINWPLPVSVMSERDKNLPCLITANV